MASLKGIDFTGIAIIAGGALVLYGVYKAVNIGSDVVESVSDGVGRAYDAVSEGAAHAYETTKDAVKTAVPYVNPADEGNIINRGFLAVGRAITGDDSWTLGGAIYDMLHSKSPDPQPSSKFLSTNYFIDP